MFFRGQKYALNVVAPLLILFMILLGIRDHEKLIANHPNSELTFQQYDSVQDQAEDSAQGRQQVAIISEEPLPNYDFDSERYREVFSVSTTDKKYFLLDFHQYASNPNIIPSPKLRDTYVIVAQQEMKTVRNYMWWAEIACNATFEGGFLKCIDEPIILPISPSAGLNCNGPLKHFGDSVGPHDARVFYGPKAPLVIYGSNSVHTCFGQWILDFKVLVDSGYEAVVGKEIRQPTEMQRPAPWSPIEKNWFVFWDNNEQIYVHHDVWPKRVFAQLNHYDGTVGQDLAPFAASDEECLAKYMPEVSTELDPLDLTPLESIHQATNSLSITMCKESDPFCRPDDLNTFIFTIFQHKTYLWSHSVYEPYVMVFRRTAPFQVYGISRKPIWIHGRGGPGAGKKPDTLTADNIANWKQTEMFYVTSMSWKNPFRKYQGYIDDVLFISFGIEDCKTAGIDIVAADLFADLALC